MQLGSVLPHAGEQGWLCPGNTGHVGAAQGKETGRAVQAAPCLHQCGKRAELPSPSLVPWPVLPWSRKHGFGTAAIKSKTSRMSLAVLYRPSSSCLEPPRGAEHRELRVQHAALVTQSMYQPSGAPHCSWPSSGSLGQPWLPLAHGWAVLPSGEGDIFKAPLAHSWELAPSQVCSLLCSS